LERGQALTPRRRPGSQSSSGWRHAVTPFHASTTYDHKSTRAGECTFGDTVVVERGREVISVCSRKSSSGKRQGPRALSPQKHPPSTRPTKCHNEYAGQSRMREAPLKIGGYLLREPRVSNGFLKFTNRQKGLSARIFRKNVRWLPKKGPKFSNPASIIFCPNPAWSRAKMKERLSLVSAAADLRWTSKAVGDVLIRSTARRIAAGEETSPIFKQASKPNNISSINSEVQKKTTDGKPSKNPTPRTVGRKSSNRLSSQYRNTAATQNKPRTRLLGRPPLGIPHVRHRRVALRSRQTFSARPGYCDDQNQHGRNGFSSNTSKLTKSAPRYPPHPQHSPSNDFSSQNRTRQALAAVQTTASLFGVNPIMEKKPDPKAAPPCPLAAKPHRGSWNAVTSRKIRQPKKIRRP